MSEPEILIRDSGPRLYQAMVVRRGLMACQKGFRLNRAYTPSNCLRAASLFTGKKYGRGKKALAEAISDITIVIDEVKSREVLADNEGLVRSA